MTTPTTNTISIDQVREELLDYLSEGRSDEAVEMVMSMLTALRDQNTDLTLKLAALLRERSGRRSEKIDPNQLTMQLQLLGDAADDARVEGRKTSPTKTTLLHRSARVADRRQVVSNCPNSCLATSSDTSWKRRSGTVPTAASR